MRVSKVPPEHGLFTKATLQLDSLNYCLPNVVCAPKQLTTHHQSMWRSCILPSKSAKAGYKPMGR